MMHRLSTLLGVCLLAATATAPQVLADPPADPTVVNAADVAPAPAPVGAAPIAPAAPGTLTTPDGWTLTISGKDESLEPVAALTGSAVSREYLVDGTFVGAITGGGKTKLTGGTLEAGYQIGCGIIQDTVESYTTAGVTPGIGIPFISGTIFPVFLGLVASQALKVSLKPGQVNIVAVDKKSFKGSKSRVSITGFRVKIDGCAGQSFIRSYATFTGSTDNTDDVVTYYGVTRAV
ncbi:MAG: MspA family porin [Mycobacterium sp.]